MLLVAVVDVVLEVLMTVVEAVLVTVMLSTAIDGCSALLLPEVLVTVAALVDVVVGAAAAFAEDIVPST